MSLNDHLDKLITYMQTQMGGFQEHLNENQISMDGKADAWSAKDNLFHALVWAERRLEILKTLEQGKSWTDVDYGDIEDENHAIFNEYRNKTWDDVQVMVDRAYLGILDYLGRIDEKVLRSVRDGEERTIWRSIVDNYVMHPMIHLWGLLVEGGKIDKLAKTFGDHFFELVLILDDSDQFQGSMLYNQACLHTLTGNLDKAVQVLGKALKMTPALIDWSKEDSDLDALRDLPDFKALYE
jgi:hypothetical protein